jgi:HEPN domain-containing protein
MNRRDWQRLANDRLADARVLLAGKRWSAAYYLAGYAVECGLKACILVRVAREGEVIFLDRRFSEKCWTHDLEALLELAGLRTSFDAARAGDAGLAAYWDSVKDWDESKRYIRTAKDLAEQLYEAVADKKHGVLRWIKSRW